MAVSPASREACRNPANQPRVNQPQVNEPQVNQSRANLLHTCRMSQTLYSSQQVLKGPADFAARWTSTWPSGMGLGFGQAEIVPAASVQN